MSVFPLHGGIVLEILFLLQLMFIMSPSLGCSWGNPRFGFLDWTTTALDAVIPLVGVIFGAAASQRV